MNRLYETELIYGRLLTVNQPHLIARYNKALTGFKLPNTGLNSFDIDRTGFSPQIAEELNNYDYMDPNGVSRRFIVLSPQQVSLPVVHTQFSNTDEIMHEFFHANMRALNALTIKDVLFGEINDNTSQINDIEDLLSIEQVEFKVFSGDDTIGKANELRVLLDRLRSQDDAWRDNTLLNRMVALVHSVGDIRRNALVPEQLIFQHPNYWTGHLGGAYVFTQGSKGTIICDANALGFRRSRPWQITYLPKSNPRMIFDFLMNSNRLDIPSSNINSFTDFIDHRAHMIILSLMHSLNGSLDFSSLDKVAIQAWMQANASLINDDGRYPFLMRTKRTLSNSGYINLDDIPLKFLFLLLRAKPDHKDVWLTNRLITDYVPEDFVSLYVFNKQRFYKDYATYSETYRAHVVHTLKNTYLSSKAQLRERLYGIPRVTGGTNA